MAVVVVVVVELLVVVRGRERTLGAVGVRVWTGMDWDGCGARWQG